MRTIRQQLFRSHLMVMIVAIVTIAVGAVLIGAILYLFNVGMEHHGETFTGRRGNDTIGLISVFGVLAAAFVAASLIAWRVAIRMAEPLEVLRGATQRMSAGDYSVRVELPDAASEVRRLAGDVNELAAALDATERRRMHLIGEVAHELRTPLSTIEGSMEALMDGVVPANNETFADIGREAARLRRLAGDLSALSSTSEIGEFTGEEPVDLSSIATEVVERLRSQAEAKNLTLNAQIAGPSMVRGDADRLTQILVNVVGNAIQYTQEGTVTVDVRSGVNEVVTTVTDSGRGIASQHLDRVFERFFRVDAHFADGTGVGLTIAQSLASAHGGSLHASSAGPDRGSQFVLRLPSA